MSVLSLRVTGAWSVAMPSPWSRVWRGTTLGARWGSRWPATTAPSAWPFSTSAAFFCTPESTRSEAWSCSAHIWWWSPSLWSRWSANLNLQLSVRHSHCLHAESNACFSCKLSVRPLFFYYHSISSHPLQASLYPPQARPPLTQCPSNRKQRPTRGQREFSTLVVNVQSAWLHSVARKSWLNISKKSNQHKPL